MHAGLVIVALAGCGRIGFGALPDDGAAGGDGGGDAGSAGFCASLQPAPTFCDDFDDGEVLGHRWSLVHLEGGGIEALTDQGKSAPAAASHTFPAQASGITATCLDLALPGTTSQVSLAYDFFLENRPASGTIELGSVNIQVSGVGAFYNDLAIRGAAGDSYHEELTPLGSTFMAGDHAVATFQPGRWYRVATAIDLAGATFTFTIDGTTVASGATRFAVQPGATTVQDGMVFTTNATPSWTVRTDNVVIDAR
jgi:hypothetical protein